MTDSLLSNLRSMGRTHDDATVAHEAADEIERLAEQVRVLRETMQGIVSSDWRRWEELASPDEFVRWAKARANHALEQTK